MADYLIEGYIIHITPHIKMYIGVIDYTHRANLEYYKFKSPRYGVKIVGIEHGEYVLRLNSKNRKRLRDKILSGFEYYP